MGSKENEMLIKKCTNEGSKVMALEFSNYLLLNLHWTNIVMSGASSHNEMLSQWLDPFDIIINSIYIEHGVLAITEDLEGFQIHEGKI